MAESISRKIASDIIEPSSAGLYPLGYIPESTKQALIKNGCSTDDLSSKPLRRQPMEDADVIVNMSGGPLEYDFHTHARENPHLAQKIVTWKIEDPYGADEATYQRILEQLESRISGLADRLRAAQQVGSA